MYSKVKGIMMELGMLCHYSNWILWVTLWSTSLALTTGPSVPQEVCMMESFEARCQDGEVISMTSAVYGRMRQGRCVPVDVVIGCMADVTRHFDEVCSGRQSCSITVPDANLHELNVCPLSFSPYLEASYRCEKVLSMGEPESECRSTGHVMLDADAGGGVISSSSIYSRQSRTSQCPWIIRSDAGQRINISLTDFGPGSAVEPDDYSTCVIYATISEDYSGSSLVCHGQQRLRAVYTSKSSRIQIEFPDARNVESHPNFLLTFSVTGCSSPDKRGNDLLESSPTHAVLYCRHTSLKQRLVCQGSSWSSQVKPCAAASSASNDFFKVMFGRGSDSGILIILGVGIFLGIILGICLLTCIVMCVRLRKRSKRRRAALSQPSPYYMGRPAFSKMVDDRGQHVPMIDYNATTMRYKPPPGHYAHRPPPPSGPVDPSDPRLCMTIPRYTDLTSDLRSDFDSDEHIYERPQ